MNTLASLPIVGALVGVVLFLAERWRRRRAESRARAAEVSRDAERGRADVAEARETVNVAAAERRAEAVASGAEYKAEVARRAGPNPTAIALAKAADEVSRERAKKRSIAPARKRGR